MGWEDNVRFECLICVVRCHHDGIFCNTPLLHQELELTVTCAKKGPDDSDAVLVRRHIAVVVEPGIVCKRKLEADEHMKLLLTTKHDVTHAARLPELLRAWIIPDHQLIRVLHELAHEAELLAQFASKEDGQVAKHASEDDEKNEQSDHGISPLYSRKKITTTKNNKKAGLCQACFI